MMFVQSVSSHNRGYPHTHSCLSSSRQQLRDDERVLHTSILVHRTDLSKGVLTTPMSVHKKPAVGILISP